MALADFQPETREIQAGGGQSFAVKGLALTQITVLIREHFPDLDAILMLFQEAGETPTVSSLQTVILSIVSQAPGLAANLIALAAGEGDARQAEKLPLGVQIKALQEIGELTFTEVGSVGKLLGAIAALMKNEKAQKVLTKMGMKTG
jgi:hypothetical protein